MSRESTSRVVSKETPPRHPRIEGGQRGGSDQAELDFDGARSIADRIRDTYAVLRTAVDVFGGRDALANFAKQDSSETGKRLNRGEDKAGNLLRSFYDYVGIISSDWKARESFLFGLCDLWGFKHPELRRDPTVEEKYRRLLSTLTGTAGEAILKDAAEAGGFHVGAFRR